MLKISKNLIIFIIFKKLCFFFEIYLFEKRERKEEKTAFISPTYVITKKNEAYIHFEKTILRSFSEPSPYWEMFQTKIVHRSLKYFHLSVKFQLDPPFPTLF